VGKAKGFYEDEGIDLTINPGGPNLNADSLVASGADDFGLTGGAESQLASLDKGLPLVAIGVSHQITPYVFVAKPESGIKTLEDFKGKTVSVWYSGAQHTLKAMLGTAGITENDFTLQPQSASMTPFIDGQVDVATATLYNEYQTLLSQGLTDLTLFQPDDYGASVPRDTLVTTKKMIETKPELVQRFLNATLKGWQYALHNPEEAVDIVLEADPSLDRDHQTRQISVLPKLMLPDGSPGLMAIPYGKIEALAEILKDAGAISAIPDIKAGFDDSFWKAAPADLKTL
jgi:NitT/TauT family transport system substrate-binding protein